MYDYTVTSDKSPEAALADLKVSLAESKFGVLWELDIVAKMKEKGIDYPGQIIIILGAGLLARWAVPRLKERLTYPRTGYVEYQRPVRSRRLARVFMAGLLGFAITVLTAFLGRGLPERLWSFFIGLTLALAFAYLGARIGLPRFYALAGFSLLLGAAGSWLNLPDPWSAAFIFGLEGLAWLVCGALVLRHYLRSTRPLEGEDLDE